MAFSVVFFAVGGPLLHERCLSQVVPSCLVAMNCTAEGYEPVCALLKCAFFDFSSIFCFFFRGGSNMVAFRAKVDGTWQAKFPTTFATSCNRPSALWASQPSLLSCSLFSTFLLRFTSLFSFFLHCFLFSPFSLFPSLFFTFFSTIFQYFSFTSSHFPLFLAFFGQSETSSCDPFVSNVPHEAPHTHRTRHVVKEDFCIFLGIFWAR